MNFMIIYLLYFFILIYIFMENNTQIIEVAESQVSSSETNFSILELLNHVRKIWLNPGQRISRGEYLLAWLPFTIISALFWAIIYKTLWLSIYDGVSAFLGLISLIMWVRLMLARLHDLNKSWRNSLWIILSILLFLTWWIWLTVLMFNGLNLFWSIDALTSSPYVIRYIILALSSLIWFVCIIITSINLLFFKWTVGDNKYWQDPLLRQSLDNTNYLILFILWVALSIIIWMWWPKSSWMSMWWIEWYNNSIGLTEDLDYNTWDLNISPSQQ